MTSVKPTPPADQLKGVPQQGVLDKVSDQRQTPDRTFQEIETGSPALLREVYASKIKTIPDDIPRLQETLYSETLQKVIPQDKSLIVYSDEVNVELLDWYASRFFPAIVELSKNGFSDFTGIKIASKEAPKYGAELEKNFERLEKDLAVIPQEKRSNYYVVKEILYALNHRWFSPQGILLVANKDTRNTKSSDFFSSIEPRIILAKWGYTIRGRITPVLVTKSFVEPEKGKNLGNWNPLGLIEMRWDRVCLSAEGSFRDKSSWANTPLLKTARILDARLNETYRTPGNYLPYLFETVLHEEMQHARDGYFVAAKTNREILFHDDRYTIGFNQFNIRADSLLSKTGGDYRSTESFASIDGIDLYKGDLIGGFTELSGQLSAASCVDPKIRLGFWLSYLQKAQNPLHTIASMFGTKLVLDKWMGKHLEARTPGSLTDEKNWESLFSPKGIEMLCFIPEFLVDMPVEKLRSVMKTIAQENFVVPVDGGIFRTVTDDGSFL